MTFICLKKATVINTKPINTGVGTVSDTIHNAIDVKNLVFGYNSKKPIISINNWRVRERQQLFLHGASGSGKSTFLNLLCGILTPQSGEINLLSKPFSKLPNRKRDQFRASHIGVVFQEFNLIPFLTVRENIELAAFFGNKNNAQVWNCSREIFSRLQLKESLFSQRADSLSVGQRQRVSIARALINSPEILIADEPTSALDSDNRDEFIHLLLEISEQSSCTVVFVSHDRSLQSHFSCHQSMHDVLGGIDVAARCS
ncbi:MAG: ABC transporter ATP-binding protein [Gammaproteobacteria bacterium]|nr:ABC transporter ATP-binding protein [Gammaproteobacteria bacterium]